MGKAVQYTFSLANTVHSGTVLFLVQEKSRFLTVFHNFHAGINRLSDKALVTLHAFLLPHLGIAAFINAANCNAVFFQYSLYSVQNLLL